MTRAKPLERSGAELRIAALIVLAAALVTACGRPGGPQGTESGFGDASVVFASGIRCPAPVSAEPLPARPTIGDSAGGAAGDVFFVSDLFGKFKTNCGGCHVGSTSGGFVVSQGDFAEKVTRQVVETRIATDDAAVYMPPRGGQNAKPYSARDANDPVVELVRLLRLWIDQGSPPGSFLLHPPGVADGGADATLDAPDGGVDAAPGAAPAKYTMPPDTAARLTNIGSCVPSQYIVGLAGDAMDGMDRVFTRATELPDTLAETDLTTFDSEALARRGVISYLPAYPLWSDAAGKMRHVRTPRGQSIAFDKATQSFRIPPDTRFYKTFLKKIVQPDGSEAWRKIETRVIVARPDETLPNGTVRQTALFGTYVWDAAETNAVLLRDPFQNGKPFTDRLMAYVADEPRAQAIRDTKPLNLEYALNAAPGVMRHYAIPSSERCIQCHMGAPGADFVLGFLPLQIATVAPGASGVIERAAGDELTQLRRLIAYGVVSGIVSPADVLPLEQSQLPRTPRNDYELQAQAYLLGNCAHCHNPRGFPSVKAPDLKDALNFMPGPEGGIFQFPLDRTSPMRGRGKGQDVPIPYITPSLRDLPNVDALYPPKYVPCPEGEEDQKLTNGWCVKPGQKIDFIDAPWRSLIYRNVDTPFDYVDDYTIFPHMPRNTAGHDCRAARILGDWMVSIPAARVSRTSEDVVDGVGQISSGGGDKTPQPYVEVKPGESGYAAAQTAAQTRLDAYHAGHRYNFCPDTTDIVDPAVLGGNPLRGDPQTPADKPLLEIGSTPERLIMPAEGVPNRAHWVVTDTTDPPGDWLPRGTRWPQALIERRVANPSVSGEALANLQDVLAKLADVTITDELRRSFLTEVPSGVWKQKPGCDFAGVPTAGSFQGDERPMWMDGRQAPAPDAPVYMQSAGEAVFANICLNCHGPQADANGLLANEISIMTGGDARVANFRTGLFGPLGAPGGNRSRVFGQVTLPSPAPTPDDLGARYLAWMALGGTEKLIPQGLLTVVATTPVFGRSRSGLVTRGTPNMLQLAQQLCTDVLLSNSNHKDSNLEHLFATGRLDWSDRTSLIGEIGDAELWLRVCSASNRPVVRVAFPFTSDGSWTSVARTNQVWIRSAPITASGNDQSLYWGDSGGRGDVAAPYPATAPVMDHRGRVAAGIRPDNMFPLCVREPVRGTPDHAAADAFLERNRVGGAGGNVIPYCPAELFSTDSGGNERWRLSYRKDPPPGATQFPDAESWANRGAINAGIAVFLYVERLAAGAVTPKPPYTQCQLLNRFSSP